MPSGPQLDFINYNRKSVLSLLLASGVRADLAFAAVEQAADIGAGRLLQPFCWHV